MASLPITIKTQAKQKVVVEIDANNFERLLANFGFFNQDFLHSLDQAEKDYQNGRIKKINSLKSLN